MKKLLWFRFLHFLIICVGYMGITILLNAVTGRGFDLIGICSGVVGFSIIFTLLQIPIIHFGVQPRLKYLENHDCAKPSFKFICSSVIDMPQGFDFTRLKTGIAQKWVITFADDVEHVIKFSTKLSFFKISWGNHQGTAAWLKFDIDTGKIYTECFPIDGNIHHSHSCGMLKEIEEVVKVKEEGEK